MPAVLVTATLEDLNGFTDQSVVNSFAFSSDVPIDAAVVLDIHNAVTGFYNVAGPGGVNPLAFYISNHIDRAVGAMRLRMYDISNRLDGSPHGSPIADDAVTLVAGSVNAPIPSQAAGVLTLRARNAIEEPVEGGGGLTRPRARKTGRLYIGPLSRAATSDANGAESVPHPDFIRDALAAAEGLQDALVDGDYAWGVWSRASAQIVPITRVEMANSFGTIRRRKTAPTTRTARTFAPVPGVVLGA